MTSPPLMGNVAVETCHRSVWRVIPYTSFRTALPALALVAVNVTYFLGPTVQLGAVMLVLAAGFRDLKFDTKGFPLLIYVGIILSVAALSYGGHQAVIKGAKLILFCLASCLSVRGATASNHFPAVVALRCFLLLCGANFAYLAATGSEVFRGAHFIDFSIYSSYTIGFLVHLARGRLSVFDRMAAYGFCFLCGSTMGLLLLLLGDVLGRKFSLQALLGVLVLLPAGWYGLQWLMEVRGKEMSLEYLVSSDRGMLLTTFFDVLLPTFSVPDLLVGKGVGTPLHRFVTVDPVFNHWLKEVGQGEIYSFCLHNEPFRLLCDYGMVGVVLVGLRLWRNCSIPVLFMLAVCMMTNSYLYSFSGALVASSLFNTKLLPAGQRRRRAPEAKPRGEAEIDPAYLSRCQ